MSLQRLYPSPSDRMAIIWSLMPIKDAVVLEYGPSGTTHFGAGIYSSFGLEPGRSLFTTHISEDDVVMGDVSRLEQAILEIDQAYQPKIIFIVASAVIAVIGTDIEGVCRYMQQKVNARLISFEEGGFRGDYTYGLRAAYRILAKELVLPPTKKEEKTYNILGASAGSYRIRSDVWEITQLMQEAFGWKCKWTMGLESKTSDMEAAGNAALNLVLRHEAIEAAEILKEKCGVSYYYGCPYGYEGTLNWLKGISKYIGQEINQELVERLEEKIVAITPIGGPMATMRRKRPLATVQGDYDTLLGMKQVLYELGVEAEHLICSHSIKDFGEENAAVVFYPKEKTRIDIFKSLNEQWCLGSDDMIDYCQASNFFTQISSPFISKSQVANHLPFMGEKGMDMLLELKRRYFLTFDI